MFLDEEDEDGTVTVTVTDEYEGDDVELIYVRFATRELAIDFETLES